MHTSSTVANPLPQTKASPGLGRVWTLFLVVSAIHVAAGLLYQHFVWTEDVYREVFSSQYESGRFVETMSVMRKMSLVGCLTLPVLLWIRVAVVALLLQFGFLLMWRELPFSRLFRILTIASLTGAAMVCTKVWIFTFAPPYEISVSSLLVAPLSLAGVVGIDSYSPAARLVLQNANVFEVLWLLLVCAGIRRAEGIALADVTFVVLVVWCVSLFVQVVVVLVVGGGVL